MNPSLRRFTILAAAGLLTVEVHAATVPFTETFSNGIAGWSVGGGLAPDLVASGGADGGAYLSRVADISASGFGNVQILFRCESGCSDDAFAGDWRDTVGTLSWYFRHDAAEPLQAYARIATPANNPGASAVVTTLVQPDTWTLIELAIDADNPEFISFSGRGFDAVFSNVGRLQIGIGIPTGFAATGVRFDIDQVSLAPVPLPPAAWALFGGMAMLARVRRRRTARA